MTTLAAHSTDTIELEAPVGRAWEPVVRLVLGGIADRLALSFEDLDDLQLAVERLLAEAGAQETVRLSFEVFESGVRTRIGPLAESPIAAALQGEEPRSGELSLRRILETVVDAYGIEHSEGGELIVRLEKVVGQG